MDGRTRPLNTALLPYFKFYSGKVKYCLLLLTKIPHVSRIMILVCKLKWIQLRLHYKNWSIVQMLFGTGSGVSMRSTLTFCAIWYYREHKFLFEADNGQVPFQWLVVLLQNTINDRKSEFCPLLPFVFFFVFCMQFVLNIQLCDLNSVFR